MSHRVHLCPAPTTFDIASACCDRRRVASNESRSPPRHIARRHRAAPPSAGAQANAAFSRMTDVQIAAMADQVGTAARARAATSRVVRRVARASQGSSHRAAASTAHDEPLTTPFSPGGGFARRARAATTGKFGRNKTPARGDGQVARDARARRGRGMSRAVFRPPRGAACEGCRLAFS